VALRNLLVTLIALVLLAYGGTKLYLYFKIKHAWDAIAATAAPFAELKRGGITSSLKGAAGVTDVDIILNDTAEIIHVDRVEVLVPSIKYLLKADRATQNIGYAPFLLSNSHQAVAPDLPEYIGINVSGVHLSLDSAYMMDFDKHSHEGNEKAGLQLSGCGDIREFRLEHYREMGYNNVTFDMRAVVYIDASTPSLTLKLDSGIPQMFHINTDAEFQMPEPTARRMEPPRLANLTLTYRDESLQKRTNDLCMKHGAPDLKTILEGQLGYFQAQMRALGIEPDQTMNATYRKFLERPGRLTFAARPSSPLDLSTLKFYKASDVPALLQLSMTAEP
jgi:hypothetical protein